MGVLTGVTPYSYAWTDGPTNQDRSSLCANTYKIIVTDLNSCTKMSESIILTQPDRSDWQMGGNSGTNPTTNYIGTSDSADLVFKTNNTVFARLKANGDFEIDRIITNRIVSTDSMLNIGDNTLHILHKAQIIYGNPSNTATTGNSSIPNKGTGIGYGTKPEGIYSISLGRDVITRGENGFAFGYKLRTSDLVDNAMVIGTGFVTSPQNSDNLVNDNENSLMIGYNSRKPTLFVAPNTDANKDFTGAVGINTTFIPSGYKLAVNGKIIATEVLVKDPGTNFSNWPPDYVFYKDYPLLDLSDLKQFVDYNCHLPEIPSADQIVKEGLPVYEMQLLLLKKVEELTLYILQQQQEIDLLKESFNRITSK